MNRILTAFLSLFLAIALCACGSTATPTATANAVPPASESTPAPEASAAPTVSPEPAAPTVSPEPAAPTATLDTIGDIDVESGLFNVTITIPAEYVGETTQAELDESISDSDYKSATLNDDGSVTYVMSKSRHDELMREYREQINQSLSDMIQSGNYPSFTSIETNDDFTEFKVYMNTDNLGLSESFSVYGFYLYGGLYNHFNGTPVENVRVIFINESTGEVVSELNSMDMA